MEYCGNSGVPIAMVPCLHQSNVYIKKKLRVWRTQKCNLLGGVKTVPTSMGLQTTQFRAAPYRVYLSPWYRVCTKQMFISKGSYVYGEPKNAILLVGGNTVPTSTGLQTTQFRAAPYRADNGILRKFGCTYRHGTVFAPKQCLYQKEATGMESPKM